MKIAVCQINPIIGNLDYNKQKITEGYEKGVKAKADLVIFPELSLVGYPPLDLVEKEEFRKAVHKRIIILRFYVIMEKFNSFNQNH